MKKVSYFIVESLHSSSADKLSTFVGKVFVENILLFRLVSLYYSY